MNKQKFVLQALLTRIRLLLLLLLLLLAAVTYNQVQPLRINYLAS